MQQQYQREIETVQKKVRWYAENQELLDRDATALREKDQEIKRLKEHWRMSTDRCGFLLWFFKGLACTHVIVIVILFDFKFGLGGGGGWKWHVHRLRGNIPILFYPIPWFRKKT